MLVVLVVTAYTQGIAYICQTRATMDRPERVSLVTPPSSTIMNTHAANPKSQIPTILRAREPPFASTSFNPSSFFAMQIPTMLDIFLKDPT